MGVSEETRLAPFLRNRQNREEKIAMKRSAGTWGRRWEAEEPERGSFGSEDSEGLTDWPENTRKASKRKKWPEDGADTAELEDWPDAFLQEEDPENDELESDRGTDPKEEKRAVARAMKLLLYRQRSEHELRCALEKDDFSAAAVEKALAYVRSFGYINDARFAENYIISMGKKKSRRVIESELEEKGVSYACIQEAFEENPVDDDTAAFELLQRKLRKSSASFMEEPDQDLDDLFGSEDGYTHKIEDKARRRVYNFLARKGFSSATIWRAIRKYEAGGQD